MTTDAEWYLRFRAYVDYPSGKRSRLKRISEPLRQLAVIPDFPIRIERVGGGASPVGYAAMIWSNDLDSIYLTDDSELYAGEGWTEESCFYHAITVLMYGARSANQPSIPSWPSFSFFGDHRWKVFLEPWERTALAHDISDVCLTIDSIGMCH